MDLRPWVVGDSGMGEEAAMAVGFVEGCMCLRPTKHVSKTYPQCMSVYASALTDDDVRVSDTSLQHVHMQVCTYVYTQVHTYLYIHVCAAAYVCTHSYAHVRAHVRTHAFKHVHTHVHMHGTCTSSCACLCP